jgi:hypothetical protein
MQFCFLLLVVAGWSQEARQALAFSVVPRDYDSSSTGALLKRNFGAPIRIRKQTTSSTRLFMVTTADVDSSDPFVVLGLDPNNSDSLDKKVIKRAYKRLALKYHPDVVTHKDSTEQEKKTASDRFAKINAAYETLTGKRQGAYGSSSSPGTSSSSGGWTPPHRRKPGESSYSSSATGGSSGGVSWEDFMPKYDDEQYDARGDSFGAIFADLLSGAAGAAAGASRGGGVIQDFVEFLERNVDGYSSSGTGSSRGGDDAELTFLLQTGSIDDIANEMDDTDLVVQQLTTKLKNIDDEIIIVKADLAATTRFVEKIDLEAREAECKARKRVVENYLSKARKRLLALQTRYKQLIMGGANDRRAGGRSSSDSSSNRWDTRSSPTPGTGASTSQQQGSSNTSSSQRRSASTEPEDAWKSEGFASSGRGRGSSRRRGASRQPSDRTSSTQSTTSDNSSSRYQTASSSSPSSNANDSRTSRTKSSSSFSSQRNVPPHRRTTPNSVQDDKERLRQLKVDDEFEKLKRDLGLK